MRCPAYAPIDHRPPARDGPVTDVAVVGVVAVADGERHRSGRTVLIFRQLPDPLARAAARVDPLRAIDAVDVVAAVDVVVAGDDAVLGSISSAASSVLYDHDRGRPTDGDDLPGRSWSAAAY